MRFQRQETWGPPPYFSPPLNGGTGGGRSPFGTGNPHAIVTLNATADGTGLALAIYGIQAIPYFVDRIFIETNSVAVGKCFTYVGPAADPPWVQDFTDRGNLDIADEDQPLYVQTGNRVMIKWVGQDAGSLCVANLIIRQSVTTSA